MYKCLNCRKAIEMSKVKDKIRCPYCGYKIIFKVPPKTIVKVKSD